VISSEWRKPPAGQVRERWQDLWLVDSWTQQKARSPIGNSKRQTDSYPSPETKSHD
jgi:hypothetical protein